MSSSSDAEARFSAFVRAERARAIGLAWQLCGGDRAAAEDVAQDAFVRAYRALPGFRDDAKLSTWFYRILLRTAHNQQRWLGVRQRWQRLWAAEPEQTSLPPGDPGLKRRIAEALASLSRGQREAFVLVHLQGFTVTEAADVLDKAPGTVKSHLHRALKALRADLADLQGEAGAKNEDEEQA